MKHKKHDEIVDTAAVLVAAQAHKKSTASRVKAARTKVANADDALDKAIEADNEAAQEVERAERSHKQTLRK